jgi:RimJ/RimL family protein N-acetyltransferase
VLRLDALTKEACEIIRQERNNDISGLRTSFFLTREMQEDFYNNVVCNRNSNHRYFAIKMKNELIGMGGITNIEWENGLAEISLFIRKKYQHLGHGTRAVHELLEHGFNNMGLLNIYGETYLCSKAVDFWYKIIQKYEMYVTILPQRKFFLGECYDSIYFSIDAEAFKRWYYEDT